LAERAAYWTTLASPELKTLKYTYLLGNDPQNITLKKGASNDHVASSMSVSAVLAIMNPATPSVTYG
jgi:hypothetical protein